ncbi:NlpC/P60 family protein [Clostridium sp. Marseille-P2415]|uniref:NlpC/P60 family protein n=1 Tax=Clostridium sp. Marseille-P2415 TaxID=1805471 RepID=UPI00098850AA|nr:NlpC/P60 family protein [Clostridium sp. Marseille-P2415]
MKLKRTVRVQILAAMLMALLGACLCAYSQSYLSSYDKLKIMPAVKTISSAEAKAEELPEETAEAEETPAPFVPSLTAFNLAFLYGEGDSQEKSLGAEAAEALSLKDSDWLASIYQLANESPERVALSLGMPAGSFKGLSFNKIDITFYDEKGKQISPQSNIQEIMAMANTYFYYTAPEDYDAFLSYADKLWESSHSFQYSISDVYGCGGSLEEDPAGAQPEQPATPAQAEKTEVPEASAALESSADNADAAGEAQKDEGTEAAKEIGPGIALREAAAAESETEAPAETEASLPSVCPGHVDLHVKAVIAGLSDPKKGLFALDAIGNETKETGSWQGWTEENKTYASNLAKQDWSELYGLTLSPSFITSPLSYDEIDSYMSRLPENISEDRRKLIYYALSSVGRVPYYWGGKPASAGYEKNHFGSLVSPDEKGRSMKGLDCSGWISWVYWSALNKRLSCESTGGLVSCGSATQRDGLQPGDIIIKTGEEAHVVMFLCWESSGNMTVIHESSALANNVTISTMDANWPYYRKLID